MRDVGGETLGSINIFSDLPEGKRIQEERQQLAAMKDMEEPFLARYVSPPKTPKKNDDL